MSRLVLALAVLFVAGSARAQEEWVEIRHASLSGRAPLVELESGLHAAGVAHGVPMRVVLTGTLTDAIDGAELDARARFLGGTREVTAPPVLLPPGAHVVSADEAVHRYELELAPGTDLRFVLDVAGLAARHLVTASELRSRLDGAIELRLSVPASALPSGSVAVVPGEQSHGWMPGAFGLGFGLVALGLVARRRPRPEDALVSRARRAQLALEKRAHGLGPQFEGAIAPARRLVSATVAGRAHVAAIDRALRETASVVGPEARARRGELEAERSAAIARMERSAAAVEEAWVRLGASTADRSAAEGIERGLDDLAAEVEVGRAVDRELGLSGQAS